MLRRWAIAAEVLFAVAVLLGPGVAVAQVTTVGAATSIAPNAGTAPVRWPDVAYDPADDVYLAISGATNIQGQFLSADAALLGGSFQINATAPYAQAPRVAYGAGAGGFLVTWHETVGSATRVRGRIVRYNQAALADLDISPLGTNWEMGAAIAWSASSQEFLVAWQATSDTSIQAQRVSASGTLLGGTITIAGGADYHRDPAVTWNGNTDEFVVAYAGCVANDDCYLKAQRVHAGAGSLVGGAITLDVSAIAVYVPELAWDASTGQVLVVWYRRGAAQTVFQSRLLTADGGVVAAAALVTDSFGSYDADGLAWNPVSHTFLFVTHGTTSQDMAVELSATGAPLSAGLPFGPASATGNFNPRVASGARAEWLAVTSTGFASLTAQRFGSSTRDGGIDGGAGGGVGGGAGGGAGGGTAGGTGGGAAGGSAGGTGGGSSEGDGDGDGGSDGGGDGGPIDSGDGGVVSIGGTSRCGCQSTSLGLLGSLAAAGLAWRGRDRRRRR